MTTSEIEDIQISLQKEQKINDEYEIKVRTLEKTNTSLKDKNKDLKEKMHYYKYNCEKMNNDVKQAYEKCGELKAKVACLEKEKEHGYCHTLIINYSILDLTELKILQQAYPQIYFQQETQKSIGKLLSIRIILCSMKMRTK